MTYLPSDIKWIKNVSNTQNGSAYMDKTHGEFTLHFPNQHKGNVTKAKIGDLILIFQKIAGNNVFTHLVTPVDYELLEESRVNHKYGRKVRILAYIPMKDIVQIKSTVWVNVNFQGIGLGNTCQIDNIDSIDEPDQIRERSWDLFRDYFLPDFRNSLIENDSLQKEIENEMPELSVTEGKQRLVTHLARERNRDVIYQKKTEAIKNNTLYCEICSFSFIDKFNVEFIECHHIEPISDSGERETKLEDLALVCPNCHRMLHKKIDSEFLTMEKLKDRIERTKAQQYV
jgi:hypothetical protein